MKKILTSVFILFFYIFAQTATYQFSNDPIDVIIPSTEKDIETLELSIQGIRKNCNQIRRIIVISDRRLTDKAEWFDEKKFPFSKKDVTYYLMGCDAKKTAEFLASPQCRSGWYLQQLLKFYASYVIPDLSSNILILDSDTIFFKPVKFTGPSGAGLYNVGEEYHPPYFEHMKQFLPGLRRVFPAYSGICHHMLMQRSVLDDLFQSVELYHQMEFWKAFCLCVDEKEISGSGASEYEIYFNFVFSRTNQAEMRILKWKNVNSLDPFKRRRVENLDYVSCHAWARER